MKTRARAAEQQREGQQPEEQLHHALGVAFEFLGRRDRTVAEVQRHLRRQGVDPATVARVLSTLIVDGHLNDVRYAQRFAADKRRLEHWGTKRIEQRLLAAGVDSQTVEVVLATRAPEDELHAAIELLERRFTVPPCDGAERNRALGLLLRRGYDLELACDAIRAHERGDRLGFG